MKKWLFSDYDGTLRNGKDGKIDPLDLEFVNKFSNGNKLVIASGRSYRMIKIAMDEYDLKPDMYITNAGSLIFNNNGDLLFKSFIEKEQNNKLLSFLKIINLESLIFVLPEDEYYLFTNEPSKYDDGSFKRKNLNKSLNYLKDKDIVCYKIQDSREKLDLIIDYVKNNIPELTIINNTDSNLVEIHGNKSSKGHAIKIVQSMFHIREKQILTAGDDSNDITMLKWFTNSFVIKQSYNSTIIKYGKTIINNLYELNIHIKKDKPID